MRTRLRFKVIASLITLSISALVVSQVYWLKNLYDSIYEQTDNSIKEAMKTADMKELFVRVVNLRQTEMYKMGGSLSAQFSSRQEKKETQDGFNVSLEADSTGNTDDPAQTFSEYIRMLDSLEYYAQYGIHSVIDTIIPANYQKYDSLLTEELKERKILTTHSLEIINRKDSLAIAGKDALFYDFPVISEPGSYYRLYIDSLNRIVLRQMTGILLSSTLLLVLIIVAFIYLLRTILKQKTMEELKTDFTNNVTHELKTPIAVAFAANDVLLNYSEPVNEKQKEYLTIIKEQLSRLAGMVEQILTLSVENRATFKLNPEPVKLSELLPPLMEQHKLKTDKQLTFTLEVPENLTIHTDKAHLYNMLGNLIENAVKYTNKEEAHITIKAGETEHETHISVTDNGIGISETNQRQIFDKFYRVPQGNLHNVKGYGLGLYYIRDIITRQGGSITVASQPSKGSTFTLCFRKG